MADILILAGVLFAAAAGYKKGLIHAVFNLGYHVVALISSALLYPFVTNWLKTTALNDIIYKAVEKRVAQGGIINTDGVPSVFHSIVQSGADAAAQSTAQSVTSLAVTVISIAIVFIAVKVILSLLSGVMKGVSKVPVLGSVNKACGFLLGAAGGAVVVYILLALAAAFPGTFIYNQIMAGTIAKSMFENNLVLELIFKI